MCTCCNFINGMNSQQIKECLWSTHKDASKTWKKLWVKALKAHHSSNLQVQKCPFVVFTKWWVKFEKQHKKHMQVWRRHVNIDLMARSHSCALTMSKKLHYNLSCSFSLSSAFFDNRSIPQYPFIIPKVLWRAPIVLHHPSMFLVILHRVWSSFVIPHHHLVVAQHLSTSPHYAMSSPNQNKMSSNQNLATQSEKLPWMPFLGPRDVPRTSPPPKKIWWWPVFYTFIPLDANLFGVF